jgi:CelD/BcsL family acetyltransferase involved in cellulose biosynthesis
MLATGSASRHLTHVSRLEVGSVAAAVNFGLIFRGRYYYVLASYDDGDVSRFGPGAAHLHDLMRYAIERGLRIFDFTIGDEAYKRDWCESSHALHDHVSAVTLRGTLIALPIRGGRRLKRWIKQTPILWSIASTARSLVGSLLRRGRR